jgi:hypothetical protein
MQNKPFFDPALLETLQMHNDIVQQIKKLGLKHKPNEHKVIITER